MAVSLPSWRCFPDLHQRTCSPGRSVHVSQSQKTSYHPCTQNPDPAENRSITPTVLLKDDLINSGILSHFCVLRFSFSFSIFVYREVSVYHSRNPIIEAVLQTILIGYVMRLGGVNDGSLLRVAHVLQHVWVCAGRFGYTALIICLLKFPSWENICTTFER